MVERPGEKVRIKTNIFAYYLWSNSIVAQIIGLNRTAFIKIFSFWKVRSTKRCQLVEFNFADNFPVFFDLDGSILSTIFGRFIPAVVGKRTCGLSISQKLSEFDMHNNNMIELLSLGRHTNERNSFSDKNR